jgi:tetratricopeptide (TPR) repeat protein
MKLRISILILMVTAFIFLVSPGETYAQLGYIHGEITAADGTPIKDAKIRIEGMNTARKYSLKTDKNGRYLHAGVNLQGIYRIIVEAEGFQTDYVEGVKPGFGRDDERGIHNFTLNPGEARKLAFEMTDEEIERIRKQNEEAQKNAEKLEAVREVFNAGVTAYNGGDYETAAKSFEEVIETDAEQPAVWANLGNCYSKLDDNEKAMNAYQKAIELDPENASYLQNLGSIYAAMGQADKARETYEKAATMSASLDPKAAAINYYNMGVTYINAGKNQEASDALKKAIELDPTHGESHYQLGIVNLGLGDMEGAIGELKKYIEIDPNGANVAVAQELIKQLGG